ncbi:MULTISPECIES: hypothetical protein [Flavobacterium]|nr:MULTISPECIES: hypothetical protein [Flavobacterium]
MKKLILIVFAIVLSILFFLSCFMFQENDEIAIKNAIEKLK